MTSLPFRLTAALAFFGIICLKNTVTGQCAFPASFTNKFWFRMYVDSDRTTWLYRQFKPNEVTDNRQDNSSVYSRASQCLGLYADPGNSNTIYYLTSGTFGKVCSKSTVTADGSAVLLLEVDAGSITDAPQCSPQFTETCLTQSRCSASWLTSVSQLSVPPPFGSVPCPFAGSYQLSATYSSSECSGSSQSTAVAGSSTIRFDLCSAGSLRTTMFKTKLLLQHEVTCMGSVSGEGMNADEANLGLSIIFLRDADSLYCARYKMDSAGNVQISINVNNGSSGSVSAYCEAGSDVTSGAPNYLYLNMVRLTSTVAFRPTPSLSSPPGTPLPATTGPAIPFSTSQPGYSSTPILTPPTSPAAATTSAPIPTIGLSSTATTSTTTSTTTFPSTTTTSTTATLR